MTAIDDDNISWEAALDLPGFEPWEDDEPEPERPAGGCAYCGATEVREYPEPFGGQLCCEACFNLLIGGEADDPPWRCGNAPSSGQRSGRTVLGQGDGT